MSGAVKDIMLIAGEASGDFLAAEFVSALRRAGGVAPIPLSLRFFGAGGPRMAAAGVELSLDLTQHAVVGLVEVLKNLAKFRAFFHRMVSLALDRQPAAIVLVDFSGFNRRFAHAIRQHVDRQRGPFRNWHPRIIQYVSPQVWASRPGRARSMAEDIDLLLCLFPFEKAWYAERVPQLHVEFVGHPLVDHYVRKPKPGTDRATPTPADPVRQSLPLVLLLPGSRTGELRRHLPVLYAAAQLVQAKQRVRLRAVLPNESLAQLARDLRPASSVGLEVQAGGLAPSLAEADLALASTGTVLLECALLAVPTVALYITSWATYQVAKRVVTVKHLAMPNLLADEGIIPEFIQSAATPTQIAATALALLGDRPRRDVMRQKLADVSRRLGGPGASARAAAAVLSLLQPPLT